MFVGALVHACSWQLMDTVASKTNTWKRRSKASRFELVTKFDGGGTEDNGSF